ncbi:MAG: YciI family protein [Chitinophagaceae bacterium]
MSEFVLLFRADSGRRESQPSPEQMQASIKYWQDWMGSIAGQNKLVSPGNRLNSEGKVVKANNIVTDGPYAEIKETLGGYIIIRADDFNEAVEIAKGCPILQSPWNGNVEIRKPVDMADNS